MVYDKETDRGMADRSEERENGTRPQKEDHGGKEPEKSAKEESGIGEGRKKNAKRRRREGRKGGNPKKAR